ncbi:hypothetical protein [Sphingopyxis flava]|uniref:Uncharacterized protein n=1 Tax=Sphingopyxis flava TaxID=1507287 RepID=A0A1T5ACM8_9SPHN|nr:hypothetical protein [Sphingopyxis flava]SKB32666.1 hypothetical protein SAMN06295937_100399 [Sphingopyxis flava]
MIETAQRFLMPATNDDFFAHLGPLLTLIAPTGMTEQDRTEWLRVAADTLSGVPVDLLASSCREARFEVDHPAKVLRFIGSRIKEEWDARRAHLARLERLANDAQRAPATAARALEDNSPLDMPPEEIRALSPALRSMAIGQGWLTQAQIDAADAEQSDAA